MRPLLTHALVIVFSVTSLSAASRLNNSEGTRDTNSVKTRGTLAKSHVSRTARHKTARKKRKPYEVGNASWYGKKFHGKKTASGETYDMFQFTAAHQKLPLGTLVKVTDLRNGRWVIVRVNDRGPVPRSRIIDLSYGAAQVLGLRGHGVETVRLDIVEPETLAQNQPLPGEDTGITGMQ
jgi:peptidoglycan lytic transglycosylase